MALEYEKGIMEEVEWAVPFFVSECLTASVMRMIKITE
jgi:hypothetical protein